MYFIRPGHTSCSSVCTFDDRLSMPKYSLKSRMMSRDEINGVATCKYPDVNQREQTDKSLPNGKSVTVPNTSVTSQSSAFSGRNKKQEYSVESSR